MNYLFWKAAPVIGALVLAAPIERATANPLKIPEPDPGLLAAVDLQANALQEGIAIGDFETWYPGLYPGYRWAREITEIGSNGLFRVDYAVFHARGRPHAAARELSLLLFRPESPPGSASGGVAPPVPTADSRAARPCRPADKATASSLAAGVIEDALVTVRMLAANAHYYQFFGDSQSLSLVSRLPDSLPGAESFGGAEVRRVSFYLRSGRHGGSDLVVEHAPLLVDSRQVAPYRTTLAEGVSVFHLQYWDTQGGEWTDKWDSTNSLPRMVQVTLGLGQLHGRAGVPHELVSRIVAVPATTVAGDIQGTGSPGIPNLPPGLAEDRQPGPEMGLVPDAAVAGLSGSLWGAKLERKSEKPAPRKALKPHSKHDRAYDLELEWLGRSGIELARYVLAVESSGPLGQYDSLMNKWAGGPGATDSPVAGIPLDDFELGEGRISVRIVDQERKLNINVADEAVLRQALTLMGVDASAQPTIVDAILDWRDPDSNPHLSGVESDYYLNLSPPYFAKDGPLDDLSELLRVNGVTPAMYWGASASGPDPYFTVGLVDLFTPVSGRLINVNTASATVLQLIPVIDESFAHAIISGRAGPDGIEGTADDSPFRSPQELGRIPGLGNPAILGQLVRAFTVHSLVFEVTVDVEIENEARQFMALLQRNSARDIQVLSLYWKQLPAFQESAGR